MADVPCAWLKGPTGEQSWKRLCVICESSMLCRETNQTTVRSILEPTKVMVTKQRETKPGKYSLPLLWHAATVPSHIPGTHGQDLAYSRVAVKPQVRDACCPEIKCFNCDHSISTPIRAHEWLLAYRSHVRIVIPLMKRTHGRKSQTGFTLQIKLLEDSEMII